MNAVHILSPVLPCPEWQAVVLLSLCLPQGSIAYKGDFSLLPSPRWRIPSCGAANLDTQQKPLSSITTILDPLTQSVLGTSTQSKAPPLQQGNSLPKPSVTPHSRLARRGLIPAQVLNSTKRNEGAVKSGAPSSTPRTVPPQAGNQSKAEPESLPDPKARPQGQTQSRATSKAAVRGTARTTARPKAKAEV